MAKSLESPTKLTEFAPLNTDVPQNPSIRATFARWFGINTKPTNLAGKESTPVSTETQKLPSRSPSRDDVSQMGESTVSSNQTYIEERTLLGVLTRVSSLLAQKGIYSEAEFKQYWMPDSVSKECYECSYKFTALRRRHHCRICGQIFCSRCCHQQVPGKLMGYSSDLRACTYCCHIVLSCLQNIDPTSDASTDANKLLDDLQRKLALLQPSTPPILEANPSIESKNRNIIYKRKVSNGFQEERFATGTGSMQTLLSSAERKVLLHDSIQLKALHEEIVHPVRGVLLQNHRYKLRSVANCCIGSEVVDWLLVQDKATSRIQATAIGQALIDAGFLECLTTTDQVFIDGYALYRPKTSEVSILSTENQSEEDSSQVSEPEDTQEPLWVRQIGMQEDRSNQFFPPNEDIARRALRPVPSDADMIDSIVKGNESNCGLRRCDDFSMSSEMNNLNPTALCSPTLPQAEVFSVQAPPSTSQESGFLNELFDDHVQRLMKQLLSWQGLSLSWAEVLMPLVSNLIHTVRPDVRDDDDEMDLRQYVHLKKVPGGSKTDSRIVHGVVCTKNVANRSMPKYAHDPNILLLSSAIDYQRVESKLISLEPLMMQENDYLKNAVAKIAAFKPEVLLVEKVVSGLAQEFLFNLGITLVLNVKPSVMDRVSRCCQADIVPSIDAHHLSRPKLGSCRLFHVEDLPLDRMNSKKTLMFFDGCQSRLGATVLLRGANYFELRKIKKIVKFMIYACYNSRLEKAFLTDEFAIPRMIGGVSDVFEVEEPAPPVKPIEHESKEIEIKVEDVSESINTQSEIVPEIEDNVERIPSPCRTPPNDLKPVKELDDPLHEYLRNCQGDQSLSSTPVQASQMNLSMKIQTSTLINNSMLFRKAMEDTILSISPLVRHGLPFLETEAGRNAPLRKYLPEVLYYSQQLKQTETPPRKFRYEAEEDVVDEDQETDRNQDRASLHPFLRAKITPSMTRSEFLSLLSDFRARGVRPGTKKFDQMVKPKVSLASSDDWENISSEGDQQNGEKLKDCLDPFNLQRFCVLFSSYCPSSPSVAPQYCVAPWVVEMDFYGRNDIALGSFLERYCFHSNYTCPSSSCQSPISAHVRRFVHDTASIVIIVRQLTNPVSITHSLPGSTAKTIDDRTVLMWSWCKTCKQVSPISTMSQETWHLSFAKYLELRLYGHAYCRRRLANASEEPRCACPHPLHTEHFHYFGCRDLVASFKYSPITLKEIVLAEPLIEMLPEKDLLNRLIDEVRTVAQIGHGLYASVSEWLKALSIECVGTKLESTVGILIEQQLPERMKFRKRVEEVQLMLTSPNLQLSPTSVQESLWLISDHLVLLKRIISETVFTWNTRLQDVIAAKKKEDKSSASKSTSVSQRTSQTLDPESVPDLKTPLPGAMFAISPNSSRDESTNEFLKSGDRSHSPTSVSSSPPNANSFTTTRYRSSSEFTSLIADPSTDVGQVDLRSRSVSLATNELSESIMADSKLTTSTLSQSRLSLGALLSMTGPGSALLTSPFPSTEHHLLPPSASMPLVVYQNEPSSIIAYTLASVDYERQLAELQADLADQGVSSSPPRTSSPVGPDRWFDNVEREEPNGRAKETAGTSNGPPTAALSSNQHAEVQFSDSSTKFYCRVYYAEQFRQLRSKVFPAGEERFIRSLARCVQWAASGGKSGSNFCKTQDDRFILKQMSKMEIQSFVDLAPNYLSYTQRAIRENRPTAFCKIVGAFRIVFKNAQTNAASKQDLLVMENLFYNRSVSRKFDLKGSERNRLVSASEAEVNDCVLLDENFIKMIFDNPLYIRGHSQSVLNRALNADTQFLASQLVMDYSLLVGIDDETNQLIVGLIDYIRTFTWDKKLETFVKSSGILGGQGKMPTVVSPELYRTRFCEAMNRYFTAVPSFWE